MQLDRCAEALPLLEPAPEVYRDHHGPESAAFFVASRRLAHGLGRLGRHDEGLTVHALSRIPWQIRVRGPELRPDGPQGPS